jgi:hypothetical protein
MKEILSRVALVAALGLSGCAQMAETAKGFGQALITTPGQLDAMDREKYVYGGPVGELAAPRNGHRIALAPVAFLNPTVIAVGMGGGYAGRVPDALDVALQKLLDHRGFDVMRSASLGQMIYADKRDVLVRLELVLAGAVRDDRKRRLMYVDDPSVLLVLTEPLSGEVVARQTLTVSSTPIEAKYVVGDGINEGIALKAAYRKYYEATIRTLERELTPATILAVEPDVRTLRK